MTPWSKSSGLLSLVFVYGCLAFSEAFPSNLKRIPATLSHMGKLVRERLPNIRVSEAAGFSEYDNLNATLPYDGLLQHHDSQYYLKTTQSQQNISHPDIFSRGYERSP